MSYNRNIPLLVAAGIGVLSGIYIWEPMFKKYQRESKGTWQYEVVQQTRAEELKREADAAAKAVNAANATNTANAAKTTTPNDATEASTATSTKDPAATSVAESKSA
ncbi:hypothetical protein FBU30_006581 [Linnemannia zychae]|nr:hypothetical protein FBU30_006581 [Linnemannia zychae]